MRRPVIAGNWKMYKTISEALELVRQLKVRVSDCKDRDIVVCPSFTALRSVYEIIKDSNIKLGAQNLYPQKEGAYTGEISPVMLKDVGCDYVILGHSERRTYIKETDEFINKKVKIALSIGLTPIVCIGETLEQREKGLTESIVKTQFEGSFAGLDKEMVLKIIIAYEPVWAIGTGKTATPEDADYVQGFIRGLIKNRYDEETAANVRIQYGGSVKPENIDELMKKENIDGVLVGGASLNFESFVRIVKFQ
ncbi:MAG: triose-phosphate isomerase [Candidatus Hydrogenedentota bacterium]